MSVTEIDCQKIIAYVAGSPIKNISVKSFKVSPLSAGVTGFLGNHMKLNIQVNLSKLNEVEKAKYPETIEAFIKSLPTSPEHIKYVNEINAFKKEYHNFERLLPSLQKISKKFNHIWAPDCYLTKDHMLIFEDLTADGFRMPAKSKLMDLKHLEVAARTLGYFHSASIIFESLPSKNGTKNNIKKEFTNCITENTYVEDPNNVRYHWFECGISVLLKMVNRIKYSEANVAIIEKRLTEMKDQLKGYFKTSPSETNVICHGDLWVNNLMFRYDANHCPVECRLVDFQMTRYAPGVLDLTSMLCLCADRATRGECKEKVIAAYEIAFNEQIRVANIEPPKINFMDDYEYFRPAALVEAVLFEMITRMDEEATAEYISNPKDFFYGDRSNIALAVFERNVEYRKRLTELIVEFVDDFILV